MCAACPLPTLPTGVQDSLEPMQHGLTITTRVTNANSELLMNLLQGKNIPMFRFCLFVSSEIEMYIAFFSSS
jgi:hypothetical protein